MTNDRQMSKPKKAQPTRTTNPLHMEDLEPRRFEDLVRQLIHGFKSWRLLEATGRLGSDEGVDIRGIEAVNVRSDLADGEDEEDAQTTIEGREWRIQCKRYQRLSPKELVEVLDELVPNPSAPPYGVIVAAACDVSAKALQRFHARATGLGIVEHHVWGKAVLEDRLYLPENDHLLFAYFNISLKARRQSRLAEVRARLVVRRKLLKALGLGPDDVGGRLCEDVLLRDIDDHAFPFAVDEDIAPDTRVLIPGDSTDCRAYDCQLIAIHPHGLEFRSYTWPGWVKGDGTWDRRDDERRPAGNIGLSLRLDQSLRRDTKSINARAARQARREPPEGESLQIHEDWYVPWENLLEVDSIGDRWFSGTHVYCRYDNATGGPWTKRCIRIEELNGHRLCEWSLDQEDRRHLFAGLDAEALPD